MMGWCGFFYTSFCLVMVVVAWCVVRQEVVVVVVLAVIRSSLHSRVLC